MNRQLIPHTHGSREQQTLCRDHVNHNSVYAWSSLLSLLSESGVLNKRDMQNSGRVVATTEMPC